MSLLFFTAHADAGCKPSSGGEHYDTRSSRVARSLDRVKRLCADSPTHHVYPTRVFGSRRRAYIDLIHLARSDTPCTSVHSAISIMNARVQANRPRNPEPTGRSSPGATICCRPDAMAGRAKPFGRVASSTRSPTRPPWSKPAGAALAFVRREPVPDILSSTPFEARCAAA